MSRTTLYLACALGLAHAGAIGADAPAAAPPAPATSTPMKANEPMAGEMKKPGMTQGEVGKAAADHDAKMRATMKSERMK